MRSLIVVYLELCLSDKSNESYTEHTDKAPLLRVMRGSEGEEEEEVVFLSPEWDSDQDKPDQGASPALRRSNRKRKSVSTVPEMSKGAGSKKKKAGPSPPKADDPGKSMPRIPRTPQQATAAAAVVPPPGAQEGDTNQEVRAAPAHDFAAMLLAMEQRITTKMDQTSKAVNEAVLLSKVTNDVLGSLEEKVEALRVTVEKKVEESEAVFKRALEETEVKLLTEVRGQVKLIVQDEPRQAGFDPDLTAGDLNTR